MNVWKDILSVRLGEYAVVKDRGRLAALGLGSCIAVLVHDADAMVGGLAHVVLPRNDTRGDIRRPAKYADAAIPVLLDEMRRAGGDLDRMLAKLVGGACMFRSLLPGDALHMGQRNVLSCREALKRSGVPIVAEDVGDEYGRSVVFDVSKGSVTVRSVNHGERTV